MGMGNRHKEEAIRDLIESKKPAIILIQETKLDDVEIILKARSIEYSPTSLIKLQV